MHDPYRVVAWDTQTAHGLNVALKAFLQHVLPEYSDETLEAATAVTLKLKDGCVTRFSLEWLEGADG